MVNNQPYNAFFNTQADRELYIKLTAEFQIEWEKSLTWFNKATGQHEPTLQALNPRTMEVALEIATRQVEYDEKHGKLRNSLEELLTLNQKELEAKRLKQHQEWCKKFEQL